MFLYFEMTCHNDPNYCRALLRSNLHTLDCNQNHKTSIYNKPGLILPAKTETMGNIKHSQGDQRGSFYYEVDGKKLAEMVYMMAGEKKMIIDHTEVNESLKGQGIGKKLQAELVDYVRTNEIKVIPRCPFAKANFQKTKEWQDVLA
jgi:uncharacterized protein